MSEARTSAAVLKNSNSLPPRTIVLCFDGTDEQYNSMNTNVVKFFGLLDKNCSEQQVAYYQAGIGTYFAPGVVSPLWAWLASLMDEAVAWYLDAHVMAGYEYLMDNYRTGDKICLFGFSRGAYTARALAGMLNKVGLLPKDNLQQVSFAYRAYKRTDKEGVKLAAGFKETFSQNVKVEFVGVWDTVQSTGMLMSRTLPFTTSNSAIKVFRHALSLDEHRSRFRPNLYHWSTYDEEDDEAIDSEWPAQGTFALKSNLEWLFKRRYSKTHPQQSMKSRPSTAGLRRNQRDEELALDGMQPEKEFVPEESFTTDVLEVWFAGCHKDIGGGNVPDDVGVSLAQITLHWMVEQVMQSQCGIIFDSDELARIGFTTPALGPQSLPNDTPLLAPEIGRARDAKDGFDVQGLQNGHDQPTSSPKPYPERSDALAPLFDKLKIKKVWWILEVLPFSYAWQDHNRVWHSQWSINWGGGRVIPYKKPKFHHTVKARMDFKPLNYKPRATYDHNVIYV